MTQIPRKAVLSFSSNILITSFGLISLIFVKRYYGFEAVGMIAFSISYMALFSLISDLGLSVSHRKIVNEVSYLSKKNPHLFKARKYAEVIPIHSTTSQVYPILKKIQS